MSKLIGRIERLEERASTAADVAEDARKFDEMMGRLIARFEESDAFASDAERARWSPVRRVAWRIRFRSETLMSAVAAEVPWWRKRVA
jgi:hypothetical protein